MKFKFVVIGAGPSGILTVSKLLHHQIPGHEILWIDPHFEVGDLGKKWYHVPSNTKVAHFLDFLDRCFLYNSLNSEKNFPIFSFDSDSHCLLSQVVKPLQFVTQHLLKNVKTFKEMVCEVIKEENDWKIILSNQSSITTKNVIFTHGAEPISLDHKINVELPLSTALNPEELKKHINIEDTIAVFGSSHSAVLVLKNLFESKQYKKIINFFRSPFRYAIYNDNDTILFDNTGLKGIAADFTRENLEKIDNQNLRIQRILSTEENISQYLPLCTKVIYAVGFRRRKIHIPDVIQENYNSDTGIIAPGLYGLGIAFPAHVTNHLNEREQNVGLRKFAKHLEAIYPIWEKTFIADHHLRHLNLKQRHVL